MTPYWKKHGKFAADHGVKVAIEMHPGFVAYSPETMLRLREVAGPSVGCNYDPSHMFWQGIDPIAAIRVLDDCIYHVHAKDTQIYQRNLPKTGVLDTKLYTDERNRGWIFRTCGYGHGAEWWSEFISTLRMFNYDYVLSVEHEDTIMSPEEGLTKAVKFLGCAGDSGQASGSLVGLKAALKSKKEALFMSKIMAMQAVLLVAAAIAPALGQTTDPKATDATGNGPPALVLTTDKENSSTQGQTSPTKDDKKKAAAERPIQGLVTGADGKLIVGAVVQLKNTRTLQVRSYITREQGSYYFSGLNKDIDYEVKAQFNGKTSTTRKLSSFDTRTEPVLNLEIK